jgi:hypothetical protein
VYRTPAGHLASEWMLAEVMDVTAKEALVHYVCLSRHYDEWIDVSEDHSRIACVTNTAPCVMHTSLNMLHTLQLRTLHTMAQPALIPLMGVGCSGMIACGSCMCLFVCASCMCFLHVSVCMCLLLCLLHVSLAYVSGMCPLPMSLSCVSCMCLLHVSLACVSCMCLL